MKIQIKYCVVWNYLPRATSLAAALKKRYVIEPILIPGDRGAFDILINERLIFSKKNVGRFPDSDEEIFSKIDSLQH